MPFSVGLDTSALNAEFKAHAQRGIGRYVSELKRTFDSLDNSSVAVGYFNHDALLTGPGVQWLLKKLPGGVQTVRQQLIFPFKLATATSQFNCVHFPAHMDAPSWGCKRSIVTVLDLIPLILSDLYRPERGNVRFYIARWLEIQAIKHASLILAISENTARDVHRILRIPEERIVVTPLGVDEKFFRTAPVADEQALRARLNIPPQRPILLYVGGIDQRKNYRALIAAMAEVVRARRAQNLVVPVLVMAGGISGDRQYPKLLAAIKQHGIEDCVLLPGYVADADLLDLYSIATLFVFPSLYEGFGLPPLEAMAAGLPVVSSNASSMPEVLGDAAAYIDPSDPHEMALEILRLLDDPERRQHLSELGRRRAQLFPWRRTGEATLKAYERFADQVAA